MKIRLLIHPTTDGNLLERVVGVLESAVVRYPDDFDKVKDKPNTVDHYGFRTSTRSLVVLAKEDGTTFYRLSLPLDEDHIVFAELRAIIKERLS